MNKAGLTTKDALTKGLIGALPDFIILGAQKAGTGSLFDLITASERVLKPATKEIMYFDRYYHKGSLWYRAHFPNKFIMKSGNYLTGEASPGYIYHATVPRRMAALLPERTKFIVLLRNPVDRAYSHYKHEVRKGCEDLSFAEALKAEPERLQLGREILQENPRRMHNIRHFSYLDRGYYARQLKKWFEIFDRERFFIVTTESLKENPGDISARLAEFLQIEDLKNREIPQSNRGNYQDSTPPEIAEELREHYRPYNQELMELTGLQLNWD